MNQFVGIADAHGIESFIPITNMQSVDILTKNYSTNQTIGMLNLRAQANRHRHAVVYRVEIDEVHRRKIEKMQAKGKHKEALIYLKNHASVIEVGKNFGMKKSWNLIPNDDLDPFS